MNRKIDGTFFEFHHHNTPEGKYWNPTIDQFTAENWRQKVKEISALGMEYIVVMATALYDKCYFKSSVFPFADIPCIDPVEELLQEADNCNIKVFLGNGFYGDWTKASQNITSKEVIDSSETFCEPHGRSERRRQGLRQMRDRAATSAGEDTTRSPAIRCKVPGGQVRSRAEHRQSRAPRK